MVTLGTPPPRQSVRPQIPSEPSYRKDLGAEPDVVLPGHAEDVRQVQGEVDDSSAGGGQIGSRKRRTEEKALHDGHHGKGRQEEEDHAGVAVRQQVSFLRGRESRERDRRIVTPMAIGQPGHVRMITRSF